ncbi:Bug family tripartite tricarboxylate transporter substrate binding protein [Allonocardiopsis opalescens]|uniref:Putative tricarboxylic transport membrane protein n=1 Tax=Allonocardiopsis opalescens TaxID=1144618 RepID=A0A2T0QEH4_9ACTN|nr:tripartite tricarboxylate transporter substrate-binding protein [Allonocardiopsis opalescens]PRY02318.1 putative tricarboxylic transport membrane protein [Allonocardiopsis opalescens]
MSRARPVLLAALAAPAAAVLALSGCAVGPPDETRTAAEYPDRNLTILAPGSTGGGWDTRARSIGAALTDCGLIDRSVTVRNTPGAGGTIGLAQFSSNTGDPHELMVMDTITMLGGIVGNHSPVSLDDVTPIAGLTVSSSVVVVPADSPYRSLEELNEGFRADPRGTSWVGGSLGGPDHILVGLLAMELGIPVDQLNYVATGGGGEVLNLLVSGTATAAVSTLVEVRPQIEAGELRALAAGGDPATAAEIGVPTLDELGLGHIDVASVGGVMAPAGISEPEREAVIGLMGRMRETPCWQESLRRNDWADEWLPGEEFAALIEEHERNVTELLTELGLAQ